MVYLGTRGEEHYAVKLLHGPVGDERVAFLREVELAKHVARFCTAQVIEAGFDDGRPYIVSEYVDGPSLQRHVALTGPPAGGALERIAVGTATALAAIHRAGIVHRDFKPQNVLLGADGPRVIDFGLARALDAAATVSGRGVGTPAYMAPEQITASVVTGAADVFSWGATMCFAANASAPFGQDSVAPVLHRILTAEPELGRLDGRLRELVEACLDKDPRNRPASRELLLDLLGDPEAVPAEVLRSPPPHILRVPPMNAFAPPDSGPDHGPVAQPEVTGTPGGYRLAGAAGSAGHPVPGAAEGAAQGTGPGLGEAEATRRTGRAFNRAGLAVSAALLVSAAVLAAVVVPAFRPDGPPQAAGRPTALTTAPAVTSPSPGRTAKTGVPTPEPRGSSSSEAPARVPAAVRVPALAGLDQAAAIRALKRAGLVAGAVTRTESARAVGRVLSTQPGPGALVSKGSTVGLRVSAGLAVPAVAGLQREPAEAALTGAGLAVGQVTTSCSAQPNGQVLSSEPEAGSRVAGGARVSLVVSRQGVPVPSVTGQAPAAARAELRAAGFAVRRQNQQVIDQAQVGTVLAQSVAAGGCAGAGGVVVITVGVAAQTGPDPTEPSDPPSSPPPEPPA
ncbi:hypothetical protein GCM10012289_55210 [Nonomuraea cavernae]|uniref:non-specific serine/threonine protein kinase n=1 Tax=Nonomuraea cavernae TaxID=2045107 RepID=A0A918DPG3_9ACTN|nr:hypothetical protein GCM10012289_55210 [Nonomuraea cavernae]